MIARLSGLAFHSFRTRLLVFVLVLLLPVLFILYSYVNYQNAEYTSDTIDSYLALGADVFDFSMQEHQGTLLTIASTLTRDWGFRNAFGAGDPATILDASRNLLSRTRGAADMLLVADLDGEVIADTAEQGMESLQGNWSALAEEARQDEGRADGILTVAGRPHLVTVVPLFLPRPVAWIYAGFELDAEFVETVKRTVVSDISVLRYERNRENGEPTVSVVSSTLTAGDQQRLLDALDPSEYAATQRISLEGSDYGTLVRSLYGQPGARLEFVAAIQRSYSENEENLQAFRNRLLQFYVVAILASLAGAVIVSRGVTRPVEALARRVERIDRGDYGVVGREERETLQGRDEIAALARSVDSMAMGLAEKEQVRDLLGKVVSREVADELMQSPIELGGEERPVTVLFVDILGFTGLAEHHAPAQVLSILNTYLSEITAIVEEHHGIVDKYNGDAVMAVFGAPVHHDDDVGNAIDAVLAIRRAVDRIRKRTDVPALQVGMGLHCGPAVAGNIGSESRMNYTVIGDTVNLAARLESLCRHYDVDHIISQDAREAASDKLVFLPLDRVRVKGRTRAVTLYEVAGLEDQLSAGQWSYVRHIRIAFSLYRDGNWREALELLREVQGEWPRRRHEVLIRRLEALIADPPDEWDGVFTFDTK